MAKAKQFHVYCNLPNASELINGLAFQADDDGVRTADSVVLAVAAQFKDIPGYRIVPASSVDSASTAPAGSDAVPSGDAPAPDTAPAPDAAAAGGDLLSQPSP